jgi:hypothetical protein
MKVDIVNRRILTPAVPPQTSGLSPQISDPPRSVNFSIQSVTFEKVTVTFFVTFFSGVFPRKNPEKCQMLLCYLFWKGIPGRCAPTFVKVVGPLLTLFPLVKDIRNTPCAPCLIPFASRAYPRLTAPDCGKTRLNAPNRAENFSGGFRASIRGSASNRPNLHQLAQSCAKKDFCRFSMVKSRFGKRGRAGNRTLL